MKLILVILAVVLFLVAVVADEHWNDLIAAGLAALALSLVADNDLTLRR